MQNIPVDVTRLGSLMVVVPPEPRVNTETGEVRKDRDGNSIYVTGVSVRQKENRRADVIEVATPGEPAGLAEGMRVHVDALVAVSWEIEGRKGTSFRASGITPAAPPVQTAPAPAARTKSTGGDHP
ncbi:hypothetical protein ACIQVO_17890 [Streptomyces sp. NPDC101062]|uniref:SCO3933 family regulatory protein n=1 Tax=unclassified Streptomyces TaxID=2593676 RepID=UPI00380EBAE5